MTKCIKCGKEIIEVGKPCLLCGAEQQAELPPEYTEDKAQENASKNEVVLLAKRAMGGDDSVWGEIYEKTHRYVYFMALKSLRTEQDAQDVTQEVYIQAIRSIGQRTHSTVECAGAICFGCTIGGYGAIVFHSL